MQKTHVGRTVVHAVGCRGDASAAGVVVRIYPMTTVNCQDSIQAEVHGGEIHLSHDRTVRSATEVMRIVWK